MTILDWCGLGSLAAIGAAFYWIRNVPAYIRTTAMVVACFAIGTWLTASPARASDWWVMTLGLAACAFGLLIVRVMLIRSVSLLLLGRLGRESGDLFREDIRGRLRDMRHFRLIHVSDERNTLTGFGRLIGGVVSTSYTLFGIEP
jgi:hypothetical protein